MTCGSCVARVEKALRTVPGVTYAGVNLATGQASVELRGPAGTERLTESVRRAGYSAELADENTRNELFEPTRRIRSQAEALIWAAAGWAVLFAIHWLAPATGFWHWIAAGIAAVLLVSPAGRAIITGGVSALLHVAPNMDALVTIGVGAAFVGSVITLAFQLHAPVYFEPVGMILMFINLGKFIETRARREAGGAVAALAARAPRMATVLRDGEWQEVLLDDVQHGDQVRVVQDAVVPVDGKIVTGEAAVDESMMTGESMPASRIAGDELMAGTLVSEGNVVIAATGIGRDSAIGRIMQAVEQAQSGKTHLQRIADRVAGVFVPIVVGCAGLTFVAWLALLGVGWLEIPAGQTTWAWSLRCAVAVLVIACPCAMGLATPVAVLVSTGRAALQGILVRSPAALEAAGRADVVLLDKTGTITTGHPVVKSVVDEPVGSATPDDDALLQTAASAEQFSAHPLAKAIVAEARKRGMKLDEPTTFKSVAGRGIRAEIAGREVLVGSAAFLEECGVSPTPIADRAERLATDGQMVVLVAVGGECAGVIGLADQLREGIEHTVETLHRAGLQVELITGDHEATAEVAAASAGIHDVCAEMAPQGKAAIVEKRRRDGNRVIFVGDGTNDAPALAAADAGIAFAAGTDVANQAAEITLIGSDIRAVATAVTLARRSVSIIRQNLFWAFLYNIAAIPLAAIGEIPPGWAAAAMMLSSISVVLNSLRLRRR